LRSTVFRFEDFAALALALQDAPAAELPAPEGESGPDGEWVLAIFEVGVRRKATAAAARIGVREGARLVFFEERDWERLMSFALARSGHYKAMRAGSGATSSSNFPALSPDDTAPPPSFADSTPPVSSRLLSSKVLVVDDEAQTRDLVTNTLQALSLTVVTVASAPDADAQLAVRMFDLVVVDFGLPRGTGLDFVRRFRKATVTANVPVLFIAEPGGSRDAVEAFASGADDFVTKPLRAPELSARIVGLLRRARTSQPPERK
jgi:two-component system phosphate regulon response regulator PhoB